MAVPVIAVNPAYNVLFNNLSKTVLLSQLVYWDGRKTLERWGETWFVKTSADLAEEICHGSSKSVGDWLREFRKMGLIRVRRAFFMGINQLWIQVNHEQLEALLMQSGVSTSPPDDLPETEVTPDSNLPETEVTAERNLPETDFSPPVTYPTGNCISKSTSTKIIDQIQIDDDDFVSQSLNQEQIEVVRERVMAQVNVRKMTASPIRNVTRYLQVALENEVRRIQTVKPMKPKEKTVRTDEDFWGEWADYVPKDFDTWQKTQFAGAQPDQ